MDNNNYDNRINKTKISLSCNLTYGVRSYFTTELYSLKNYPHYVEDGKTS